jgi:hypothetical protein
MPKPRLRTKSITAKVTEEEYARLQGDAQAQQQTLSDWARKALLAQLVPNQASLAEEAILAELLGLRMLFLNTVQILGRKEELTTEQLRKLIERIDREKQGKAAERLAGSQPGP